MMKIRFASKPTVIVLYCFLVGMPAMAFAVVTADKQQIETMTVSVADLNLSREEGILTLYQRLSLAAMKVCGPRNAHGTGPRIEPKTRKQEYRKCTAAALDRAVQSVNHAQLTALHTR